MDKKQPSSSVPQAVHDCRNLIKWMIPHIDKLPRNRRFTLGERLENRLLLILESLVTAAYVPNKRTFLFQANRDLAVCRHLWRLCYDFRGNFKTQVEQGISGQNSRKKVKWCPRKRQDVGLPQLNIGHHRGLYKTQRPDATTLDSTT